MSDEDKKMEALQDDGEIDGVQDEEEIDEAAFAQSLINTIEESRGEPIEPKKRADGMTKFSRFFVQCGLYDEAIKYAGEACELVSFEDYPHIKTEALVCVGDAYRHKIPLDDFGDMVKDSPYIVKALEYYDQVLERDTDNAYANFGKGLIFVKSGNYENARICFEKTIKMDSSIFEAYNNLAICMSRLGDYEGAEKLYRQALEIKPDDVKSLVNLGNHYFETGQYPLCIEPYEKVVELDAAKTIHTNRLLVSCMKEGLIEKAEKIIRTETERVKTDLIPMGTILLASNNFDKTIDYYKNDLANGSGKILIDALYFTGCAYSGKKDYQEAMKHLSKATEMDPEDYRVIREIGNVYRDTEKYKEAEEHFKRAFRLEPDREGLLLDLADIYHCMEDYKQAAVYYERFLKYEDDNASAWYNLGLCYMETGKPGRADKCFRKASECETISSEQLFYIGNNYFDLKKYKKAIEFYKKSLEIEPDYDEAVCNIGEAFIEMGKYKKAIEYLEKAIEINPRFIRALFYAGETYLKMNDPDKAIINLSQAHLLEPEDVYVLISLAKAYDLKGDFPKTMDVLSIAYKIEPDDACLNHNMGIVFLKMNEYEKAAAYFEKTAAIEPDNVQPFVSLARVYLKMNDRDKAFINLRTACKNNNQRFIKLINDPDFDDIRNDPEFIELTKGGKAL